MGNYCKDRFQVVSGPEGRCLVIGDDHSGIRVAGPKPWGGGDTLYEFRVPVRNALDVAAPFLLELDRDKVAEARKILRKRLVEIAARKGEKGEEQ